MKKFNNLTNRPMLTVRRPVSRSKSIGARLEDRGI